MKKSQKILELRLTEIEREFDSLLISCLRECAGGRWGLFGQNDLLDPADRFWLRWPEADRLKELAEEIRFIRLEFGHANDKCERFLELCSLRGANVPGEPELATKFLSAIELS